MIRSGRRRRPVRRLMVPVGWVPQPAVLLAGVSWATPEQEAVARMIPPRTKPQVVATRQKARSRQMRCVRYRLLSMISRREGVAQLSRRLLRWRNGSFRSCFFFLSFTKTMLLFGRSRSFPRHHFLDNSTILLLSADARRDVESKPRIWCKPQIVVFQYPRMSCVCVCVCTRTDQRPFRGFTG